jgi:hypothetical protein
MTATQPFTDLYVVFVRGYGDDIIIRRKTMERNLELKDARREVRGALIGERFGETASHVARAVHSTAFPLYIVSTEM